MMNGFGRRLLAALGAIFAACAAFVPQAAAARNAPALWTVSDSDTTIYLFGTIHLLPHDLKWQTPAFDHAKAKSQALVIETIVDPDHPQPYIDAIRQLGFAPGLPPITDRVPAAKRDALLRDIAKTGLTQVQFDQMKTWFAAVQLIQLQFKEIGLNPNEGPETVLREEFTTAGKPVEQLETIAEQFGYFDRLPEAAQRKLLEGALETPDEVRKEFGPMLSAWTVGDVKGISNSFNHDLSDSPEMRSQLIKRRNANWVAWIKRRMKQPGSIMVAVGAGHLAGQDSVVDQLKRDGLHVRRIQ